MIPQETVQRILDTARIEEVIGDFVTLKRRGADYWACCPFHNEKTPSFHIIPSRGQYYCFGCHKGGSAVGFIMDYEQLSYVEALKYLARKYNIEVVEEEETAEDLARRQHRESLMLVSEYAGNFFRESLETEEGKAVGLAYFRSRGLEDETIRKYGLGWAPSGRHALTDAALAAGYKQEYLLETGLCAEYDDKSVHDRFYERVVFPIHSVSGRIVAFGARTLKSDKTVAKYVNSKESEIYDKSNSLYGIWFAKNEMAKKNKCYLVEGYLDVLSMHQLGITNVVASSGTALTEGQIRLIKRFTDNVTIMYDGDSAGIHAALRGINLILKEGMNVRIVLIPDGDDPDSYSRKHTLEEVEAFLKDAETDFIDFQASMLLKESENDPMRRSDVINEIAGTIALIPDAIKRSVYINFLNDKYRIHDGALEGRVSKVRTDLITQEKRAAERERRSAQNPSPAGSLDLPGQNLEPAERSAAKKTGLGSLEENSLMGKPEADLLNFVLAHGTEPLKFTPDSEFWTEGQEEANVTVFEFIDSALAGDGIEFVNTAYRTTYNRYAELYDEGYTQEEIVRKLLDGEDRTVAYVTVQLSIDEHYDLTVESLRNSMTARVTWLATYVPRAILAYQEARMKNLLKEQREELRRAQTDGDKAKEEEVMAEMVNTTKIHMAIKRKLGREKNK